MVTSAVWMLYFIAYGYGFLSTLIISLISQLGVITILFSYNSQIAKYLIALLIAVGASTLVSDAILHLIPEVYNQIDIIVNNVLSLCAIPWYSVIKHFSGIKTKVILNRY